jgi:hypothetical protein
MFLIFKHLIAFISSLFFLLTSIPLDGYRTETHHVDLCIHLLIHICFLTSFWLVCVANNSSIATHHLDTDFHFFEYLLVALLG